jgi:hypothetical protein
LSSSSSAAAAGIYRKSAAARVQKEDAEQVLGKERRKKEEELRRGGPPHSPHGQGGGLPWPATLLAPYPAMKPRSPRAYETVLSTVAQHQLRYEMSILPLTSEPNNSATTITPLSSQTTYHVLPLTDNKDPDDAGPHISDRSLTKCRGGYKSVAKQ